MKFAVTANVVLKAATKATQYADLVTDQDPEDGTHVVPGELRRFLGRGVARTVAGQSCSGGVASR